jgi:nicotinamidase-related amidase
MPRCDAVSFGQFVAKRVVGVQSDQSALCGATFATKHTGVLSSRLWRNFDDRSNILITVEGGRGDMRVVRHIVPDRCCGVIVDLQGFFLSQVDKRLRARIKTNTGNLVRLLGHFRIPIVVTLERPVDHKGSLPKEIGKHLGDRARTFEKDFFNLCKEKDIKHYLERLKRRQVIVAGCETDVCVLQSCLGLLSLGYEVYLMEELIFSSSRDVDAAIARMKAEGVIFLTYKSLYYELLESVEGPLNPKKGVETFESFPDDLPDSAV